MLTFVEKLSIGQSTCLKFQNLKCTNFFCLEVRGGLQMLVFFPSFLKGPLGYRVRWMVEGKEKGKSQKLVNNNETEVTQPPT